jgi:hypothetical protein
MTAKKHYSIRLTDAEAAWFDNLGNGNLTTGVRRARDIARGTQIMLERDRNVLLRDALECIGKFADMRGIE